ncbi:hypothetical protein H8356DRAFT_1340128 [Neocallimastix lanati (nom. inval.)]|nr:hypothetical protein H8356DRAFT_1340128 [Neocallimastix sp. JGI-2020a]
MSQYKNKLIIKNWIEIPMNIPKIVDFETHRYYNNSTLVLKTAEKQGFLKTKFTKGEYRNDNKIFVINIPGLQDAEGTDRKYLIQMVDYIKSNPGLQGITNVLNYHQPTLPLHIKTLIRLLFRTQSSIIVSKFTPKVKPKKKINSSNKTINTIPFKHKLIHPKLPDSCLIETPFTYRQAISRSDKDQ